MAWQNDNHGNQPPPLWCHDKAQWSAQSDHPTPPSRSAAIKSHFPPQPISQWLSVQVNLPIYTRVFSILFCNLLCLMHLFIFFLFADYVKLKWLSKRTMLLIKAYGHEFRANQRGRTDARGGHSRIPLTVLPLQTFCCTVGGTRMWITWIFVVCQFLTFEST